MWGGIYAVLFSISTILSVENPIKNGFVEKPAESYTKYSLSNVEFQNEIVGKVISVVNFGAGDLLEIYFIKSSKKEFFRFTETNFPEVDIKEKRITIKS